MPDEILIADDGSDDDTKQMILKFSARIPIPIKHFWQEDKGFRKSKILNKAIATSESDYIIQIDGDCILHNCFIEDHINQASKMTYLYGSRVNILQQYVSSIINSKTIHFSLFSKEIKNRTRCLHIPILSKCYRKHNIVSRKFRGCNLSYWREDFIAINGYNEDFEGWGREDSDLVIRLGNKGILAKRIRYAAIVYHIYHKTNSKHNFELNNQIQNETITKKIIWIDNGVNKYF
jgi:glycosyltransferase involved in cell wall biosynthesis